MNEEEKKLTIVDDLRKDIVSLKRKTKSEKSKDRDTPKKDLSGRKIQSNEHYLD